MRVSKFFICVFLCAGYLVSSAQDDESLGGKFNVVRDYKPKLQDARKLSVPLSIEPIRVKPFVFDYKLSPKLFELNPTHREKIQPISLGTFKEEPLPYSEVLLGLGNYQNLWAEVWYGQQYKNQKQLSIGFQHRSGKAAPQYSNFSRSSLEIAGKKHFKRHTLAIKTYGNLRSVHHYADFTDEIPDSFDFDADSIKSKYAWAGVGISFGNQKNNKARRNYITDFEFYYLNGSRAINEWSGVFDALITEKFNSGNFASFSTQYDINAFSQMEQTTNRSIIRVNAAYHYLQPNFRVKLGFKTASDNAVYPDINLSSLNNFHIYPDLRAEYDISKGWLMGFVGIDGQLVKNDYRTFAIENPFVNPLANLRNTNEALRVFAGLQGNYSEELSYELSFHYKLIDNMLLYANNDSISYFLQPVYSGSSSSVVNLHAEIKYRQKERVMAHFTGNFYNYGLIAVDALHLPTLDGQLDIRYHFQDKLRFSFNVFLFNSRATNTVSRTEVGTISGALDMNIGADYVFGGAKTSFFLYFNNLLNQKYQVWNRYQVQGFHVLAGLKLNLR